MAPFKTPSIGRATCFVFVALLIGTCPASAHPCDKDAINAAYRLLAFNSNNDDRAEIDASSIRKLKKLKNPTHGNTYFDVLQVYGSVYKGTYRMRFIYYRGDGDCIRVGQEILEIVDY